MKKEKKKKRNFVLTKKKTAAKYEKKNYTRLVTPKVMHSFYFPEN